MWGAWVDPKLTFIDVETPVSPGSAYSTWPKWRVGLLGQATRGLGPEGGPVAGGGASGGAGGCARVRGEPRLALAPGPDGMSPYDITSRGPAEAAAAAPGAPGRRAAVAATVEDVGDLTDEDYENLLTFRAGLRRFLHWSESQARAAGLTPAQHQLLLAVRGHRGEHGPTVGDLADYLMLRHHSAVELVGRAAAAGLVERWGDEADGRVIRVRLTPDGEARLATLAPAHLDELRSLAPVLDRLVAAWADPART
jgi:DNA-binding MarR family transcriptional regulator